MRNNGLEKYLQDEIEKLKTDIENKKNRHYVNQTIIEECQERIRDYRDKDDSIFNLLSPIRAESSYKDKIDQELKTIEESNNENMILISEIDDCKKKILEIEKQLQNQKIINEVEIEYEEYPEENNLYSYEENNQEEPYMNDWVEFIDKILSELQIAENYCYSNPKACKDKIAELRDYIKNMCYGDD